jgi:hypothetical protein
VHSDPSYFVRRWSVVVVNPFSFSAEPHRLRLQSGNTYSVTPHYNGGASVNGYNIQNGTTWNTEIDEHGNMNGLDSNINPWHYDSRTKTYFQLWNRDYLHWRGICAHLFLINPHFGHLDAVPNGAGFAGRVPPASAVLPPAVAPVPSART